MSAQNHRVMAIGLLLVWSTPVWSDDDPNKAVQGTWTVVSAVKNGRAADDRKGEQLIIDGENFTIRNKDKVLFKGKIKIDAGQKPPILDLTAGEDEFKGIYEIDGETLRFCHSDRKKVPRPSKFSADKGTGLWLLTYKREKP